LSIYPVSWVVGFLSFLMPAGIGVREGMIFVLLKRYTGNEIAAVGSLLSRIEVTLGELLYLFFFIGDKKIWRKMKKRLKRIRFNIIILDNFTPDNFWESTFYRLKCFLEQIGFVGEYIQRYFVQENIMSGNFPLWNPMKFAGIPTGEGFWEIFFIL